MCFLQNCFYMFSICSKMFYIRITIRIFFVNCILQTKISISLYFSCCATLAYIQTRVNQHLSNVRILKIVKTPKIDGRQDKHMFQIR